eukprot:Clim_evm48s136 gene=Clim_evmTU48s136
MVEMNRILESELQQLQKEMIEDLKDHHEIVDQAMAKVRSRKIEEKAERFATERIDKRISERWENISRERPLAFTTQVRNQLKSGKFPSSLFADLEDTMESKALEAEIRVIAEQIIDDYISKQASASSST